MDRCQFVSINAENGHYSAFYPFKCNISKEKYPHLFVWNEHQNKFWVLKSQFISMEQTYRQPYALTWPVCIVSNSLDLYIYDATTALLCQDLF